MESNCNNLTERIFQLTLEIIYLLTGEDDIAVKKTSGDEQNSIMVPLHSLVIPGRNNEQKILEVTKKIIELLMGERGNWSNFNFGIKKEKKEGKEEHVKEQKCLEGHKVLYKDVMMDRPPLTSPDGSRKRNPPERCPSPLDSRNSTHEVDDLLHQDQGAEMIDVKVEIKAEEERYVRGNEHSAAEDEIILTVKGEEPSSDINTGGHNGWNVPQGHFTLSEDYSKEDNNPAQIPPGVNIATQNIHHNPRQTDCEKSFIEEHELVEPQRIHTNKKPFLCSVCGKSFIKRSNFNEHRRVHTGEKPFSCPECEKSFKRKSNLVEHQKIHTGEKPYSCSKCERSFKKKSNLMVHQRLHTGENPFSCSECGKSFKKKSNLIDHQKIHTSEENFSCSECEMTFMKKSVLIQHQSIHTSKKKEVLHKQISSQ